MTLLATAVKMMKAVVIMSQAKGDRTCIATTVTLILRMMLGMKITSGPKALIAYNTKLSGTSKILQVFCTCSVTMRHTSPYHTMLKT